MRLAPAAAPRPRRRRLAPPPQRRRRRRCRAAALAASRTALPTRGELRLARRATAPSPREAAPPLQPSRRRCCAARPGRLGRTSRLHQEAASGRGQHGAGLQRSRISYVLARAWSRPCRGLPTGEQGYSHTAPAEGSECCHRKERSAGLASAWNDGHPTRSQSAGSSTSIAHPGCQHSPPKRGVPLVRQISVAAASDGHEHAGRRLSARRDATRARTTPAEGVICPRRKRRPSSWGKARCPSCARSDQKNVGRCRAGINRSGADRAARIVGPHRATPFRVARCDAEAPHRAAPIGSHGATPMRRTVRRLWVAWCGAYGRTVRTLTAAPCGPRLTKGPHGAEVRLCTVRGLGSAPCGDLIYPNREGLYRLGGGERGERIIVR